MNQFTVHLLQNTLERANFLAIITNDAWGNTPGHKQLLVL